MQKWKVACISMILCAAGARAQQGGVYESRVRAYIEQFKELAIEEQKRSGVPAAITLAQGIHETSAGSSELATVANNHFGIKCKKEWTGETFAHTDDAVDECFRKYKHYRESYRDHSDYLKNSPRYAALFNLSKTNYAAWAAGLKRCGYATNPKYAPVLIKLIEDYHLQDYTYAALTEKYNPVRDAEKEEPQARRTLHAEVVPDVDAVPKSDTPTRSAVSEKSAEQSKVAAPGKPSSIQVSYDDKPATVQSATPQENGASVYDQVGMVNGIRAFYAMKGTSLLNEAVKYNLRYAKLLELNDFPDAPLEADMYVYLDRKLTRGLEALHVVKPGETLLQVSQATGVQLRYLRFYNRISANEEPVEGSLLRLQEYTDEKPEVYVKNEMRPGANGFAGSHAAAVPQGITRTRPGYKAKQDPTLEASTAAGTVVPQQALMSTTVPEEQAKTPVVAASTIITPPSAEEKDAPEAATSPASETVATSVPDIQTPAPVRREEISAGQPPVVNEEASAIVPVSAEVKAPGEERIPEPALAATNTPEATKAEIAAPAIAEMASKEIPATEDPQAGTVKAAESAVNNIADIAPSLASADSAPASNAAQPITTPEPVAAGIPPAPVPEPEPKDEFERLKRRLDKVVYASNTKAAIPAPTPVSGYTIMKTPAAAKPGAKKDAKTAKPAAISAKPAAAKEASAAKGGLYTVKKGETAFSIAKKNNISMRQLMSWNNLDFNAVKVGQQLRVKE